MGDLEFLIGRNAPMLSNLPDAIKDLEDASTVFLSRWHKGELQRAADVSKSAMITLDFIANELLREKDKRKGLGTFLNSQFASEMIVSCGAGFTGVSPADEQNMVLAGPGNGQLPIHLGTPTTLTLSELLNKIKHRSPNLMNFRIDGVRHIFIICPQKTGGGSEGIYEFAIEEFCRKCQSAANAL